MGRTLSGNLTVFVLDQSGSNSGGNVWSIAQDSPQGTWGSWSALPVVRGASLRPGFVGMENSDGRFELIAAGSDREIYKLAEEAGGRWRNDWVAIGEQNSINLTDLVFAAGNTNDGRLQVFAANKKGTVYSNWQQVPGGGWQSRWSQMGSQNGLAFDP